MISATIDEFFVRDISLKDENFFIPLIITGILIATSFAPLLQVVLLELLAVYKPVATSLNIGFIPFTLFINSAVSALLLFQFYKAKGKLGKITSNTLAVIFLYPLLILPFQDLSGDSTYMIPFILAALIFGTIFVGVAYFK